MCKFKMRCFFLSTVNAVECVSLVDSLTQAKQYSYHLRPSSGGSQSGQSRTKIWTNSQSTRMCLNFNAKTFSARNKSLTDLTKIWVICQCIYNLFVRTWGRSLWHVGGMVSKWVGRHNETQRERCVVWSRSSGFSYKICSINLITAEVRG